MCWDVVVITSCGDSNVIINFVDGVFNFLDTYEERSLKLKVLAQEGKEEMEKLEKSFQEVRPLCVCVCVCVCARTSHKGRYTTNFVVYYTILYCVVSCDNNV